MFKNLPVPPAKYIHRVRGSQAAASHYLSSGFEAAKAIQDSIRFAGKGRKTGAVLDFGCGCARILRWMPSASGRRLFGTDIDGKLIGWCKKNVPKASFSVNKKKPPLPFVEGTFGLVYSVSVFNHFNEREQFAWIKELNRVLMPGGTAIISFHGPKLSKAVLSKDEYRKFESGGFFFKKELSPGWGGVSDVYLSAYHAREYVLERWSEFFNIRAYVECGMEHWQDLVILEKRCTDPHPQPAKAPVIEETLPMGGLASPGLMSKTVSGKLIIRGWAFRADAERFTMHAAVDGRKIRSFVPDADRNSALDPSERSWGGSTMERILRTYPQSRFSGFNIKTDVTGYASGVHRLDIFIGAGKKLCPWRFSSALFTV